MKKFGIDTSKWQGDFNFAAAKADEGVEFAILKIGGGDAGLYKDIQFENSYKRCAECGLDKGAYFFGHAMNMDEAKKEADYLISLLKGKKFEYPVFYDVEADMLNIGRELLTDVIKYILEALEKAGYWAGIYGSADNIQYYADDTQLTRWSHWLAGYSAEAPAINSGSELQIWQFGGDTNKIRSNKINGTIVDQNYCYVDFPAKIKEAGLNGYPKTESNIAISPDTTTASTQVTVKPDIIYAIKTAANGWLPEVKNTEDYAGLENKAATGVMIKLSDGTPIKYRVHTTAGKWLGWVSGYDKTDYYNGYAGDDKTPIDAIEIKCDKYTIKYKVSSLQSGEAYYPIVSDNIVAGGDSYAGVFENPVDKLMAWIE